MEETNKNNKQISVARGDLIKIKFNNSHIREIKIVTFSDEVNPEKGLISTESPLGRALIGATVGEKRKYNVNGKEFEIEILEIQKINYS